MPKIEYLFNLIPPSPAGGFVSGKGIFMTELLTVDEAYGDQCTCDECEHDYHLCPFALEIDGEEKECNCCPYCTEECAQSI